MQELQPQLIYTRTSHEKVIEVLLTYWKICYLCKKSKERIFMYKLKDPPKILMSKVDLFFEKIRCMLEIFKIHYL